MAGGGGGRWAGARGRRRIGRSGAHGGERDAFYTYAEQIFFGGLCLRFFLKAAFFFFFLKAAFQMVLNAGPNDMATRTSGRIKLPSFGAGLMPLP